MDKFVVTKLKTYKMLTRLSYKIQVSFSQAIQHFYQDGSRFIYAGELIIPAI
jgi:hypothetical protein